MELLFQCVHNDEAVHWQVQRKTQYFDAVTQSFGGRLERLSVEEAGSFTLSGCRMEHDPRSCDLQVRCDFGGRRHHGFYARPV